MPLFLEHCLPHSARSLPINHHITFISTISPPWFQTNHTVMWGKLKKITNHYAQYSSIYKALVFGQRLGESLPMKYFFMTSGVATLRSICTIWPIFSSRVIRCSKSLILTFSDCVGSLYFKYSACETETRQQNRRTTTRGVAIAPIFNTWSWTYM